VVIVFKVILLSFNAHTLRIAGTTAEIASGSAFTQVLTSVEFRSVLLVVHSMRAIRWLVKTQD